MHGPSQRRDRQLILAATLLRAIATGMMGPLLAFYLAGLSYDERTIGLLVSAGLAGAALATVWVTLLGHTVARRTTLLVVTGLSVAGGAVAVVASGPWLVGAATFVGMLNGMGRDRGACLVVEQAMLPETTSEATRTPAFAWYSVMQDLGAALGSLLSGLPSVLRAAASLEPLPALRGSLGVYVVVVASSAVPYLFLSPGLADARAGSRLRLSGRSRRILTRICLLFAIDSVAGGFLTSTFLALFFRARFGADELTVAALFSARSVVNALSHFGAAWIARRIGLVKTMVFTHIPSSLLLVSVTLAPDLVSAAALFLLCETLVEMDVPTRSSYVMAIVKPDERTLASGVTHLVRMGGWAVGPAIAGLVAGSAGSLAVPLWIGAGLKIVYDGLLYASFRRLRPPEES